MSEEVLGAVRGLTLKSACFRAAAKSTGLLDRFDQPEILDDLLDGWVAKIHKGECDKPAPCQHAILMGSAGSAVARSWACDLLAWHTFLWG